MRWSMSKRIWRQLFFLVCLQAMSVLVRGADVPQSTSAPAGDPVQSGDPVKSGDAVQTGDAVQLCRRLIGGEWIHQSVLKNGKTFLSRYVITDAPDGVNIVMNGWRGAADNL